MSFSHFSRSLNGGALNIVSAVGKGVEGILFGVSDALGWEALDRKEGAPRCYRRQSFFVLDEEGGKIKSETYLLPLDRVKPFQVPNPEYVDIVARGLKHFDLGSYPGLLSAIHHDEEVAGEFIRIET
ncbi:gamma-glutamylcyclotransferase [Pirellulaceae bacterium]|nr:gamma-glutamylcyclotransferase [Pirellulaceae bacterium]